MEAWPSADRSSRLVFILDGLDGELLKRSFEAFTLADADVRPPLAIPAE
jgi:hypothetical protein